MFSLIWAWINDWVNNREAGDLRRHRGRYNVNVMDLYQISTMALFLSPRAKCSDVIDKFIPVIYPSSKYDILIRTMCCRRVDDDMNI